MKNLSRLWEELEDIKNSSDNKVPVPVGDHIKLIEQTILLLGQAPNSILSKFTNIKYLNEGPQKS